MIETERLTLRAFSQSDEARLVEIFSDQDVAKWVGDGSALTDTQAKQWIKNSRQSKIDNGTSAGAIIENSTNRLIGWGGVVHPKDQSPELIYGFERNAWRKGYGLEIADAIVADAKKRGISDLVATVDPDNKGSIRILTKLGFQLVESGVDEDGLPTDTYKLT